MIRGIIFFESGGIQQIGEFTTLSNIIAAIKQVLPELEDAEAKRVLSAYSNEELEKLVALRKATTNTGEK